MNEINVVLIKRNTLTGHLNKNFVKYREKKSWSGSIFESWFGFQLRCLYQGITPSR